MSLREMDPEDLASFRSMLESAYLHGGCVAMALALSKEHGESLVVASSPSGMRHAGTMTSDGSFRDVRGVLDEEAFLSPFAGCGGAMVVDEASLREAVSAAGGRWPDERDVAKALKAAATLHGDMPSAVAHAERVAAFARDLRSLCERHGLYLREAFPGGMVAYEAYGDEKGFELSPMPGGSLVVRRLL